MARKKDRSRSRSREPEGESLMDRAARLAGGSSRPGTASSVGSDDDGRGAPDVAGATAVAEAAAFVVADALEADAEATAQVVVRRCIDKYVSMSPPLLDSGLRFRIYETRYTGEDPEVCYKCTVMPFRAGRQERGDSVPCLWPNRCRHPARS